MSIAMKVTDCFPTLIMCLLYAYKNSVWLYILCCVARKPSESKRLLNAVHAGARILIAFYL